MFLDKMCDNFGIGLSCELMTFISELSLQSKIILDDPVVCHDDAPFAITMWVRIFFGWTSMRCPTRVAEAELARHRLLLEKFFQILQLARTAADLKLLILDD